MRSNRTASVLSSPVAKKSVPKDRREPRAPGVSQGRATRFPDPSRSPLANAAGSQAFFHPLLEQTLNSETRACRHRREAAKRAADGHRPRRHQFAVLVVLDLVALTGIER